MVCIPLPISDTALLGFHLDKWLTWNPHTRLKRQEINRRFGQLYWRLNRSVQFTIENKLLIYKIVLKSVWTYGLELWVIDKFSNIERIQSLQSSPSNFIQCSILRYQQNFPSRPQSHMKHHVILSRFSHYSIKTLLTTLSLSQSISYSYDPPRTLKRPWWDQDLLQILYFGALAVESFSTHPMFVWILK